MEAIYSHHSRQSHNGAVAGPSRPPPETYQENGPEPEQTAEKRTRWFAQRSRATQLPSFLRHLHVLPSVAGQRRNAATSRWQTDWEPDHGRAEVFVLTHPDTKKEHILKVSSQTAARNEWQTMTRIACDAYIMDSLGPSLRRPPLGPLFDERDRFFGLTLPLFPAVQYVPANSPFLDHFNPGRFVGTGHGERVVECGTPRSALCVERIPDLPEWCVQKMVAYQFGDKRKRIEVQRLFENSSGPVLLRPLFGLIGPHAITSMTLDYEHDRVARTDFSGDLDLLDTLLPRQLVRYFACRVAVLLAYMHWAVRYDGAGIELLLGGKKDDPSKLEMYCVSFRSCQKLTSSTAAEVVEKLVPAVVENHLFVPRPGSQAWAAWEETYLEISNHIIAALSSWRDPSGKHICSMKISDAQGLPEVFIDNLEAALRALQPPKIRNSSTAHACGGTSHVDQPGEQDGSQMRSVSQPRHRELDRPKSILITPRSKQKRKLSSVTFAEHNTTDLITTENLHGWAQASKFHDWLRARIVDRIREQAGRPPTPPGLQSMHASNGHTRQHPLPLEPIFDGKSEYFSARKDDAGGSLNVVEWGTGTIIIKAGLASDIQNEYRKLGEFLLRASEVADYLAMLPAGIQSHGATLPSIPRAGFFIAPSDSVFTKRATLFSTPMKTCADTVGESSDSLEVSTAGFAMDLPSGHGRLTREALVSHYYKGDLSRKMAILQSPSNRVCLVQALLGADSTPFEHHDESTPLLDFPGCPDGLATLFSGNKGGLRSISSQMGAFYAALHWYMGHDGRDIKFVLDGNLRLRVMELGRSERFELDLSEDAPRRRMEVLKGVVREKLVPAAVENGPFIPKPDRPNESLMRAGLFEHFRSAYEAASLAFLSHNKSRWHDRLDTGEVWAASCYFVQKVKDFKLGHEGEISETEQEDEDEDEDDSDASDVDEPSSQSDVAAMDDRSQGCDENVAAEAGDVSDKVDPRPCKRLKAGNSDGISK